MGYSDWILPVDTWSWPSKLDWGTAFTSGNNLLWMILKIEINSLFFCCLFPMKAIAKDGIIPFIQPFAVSSPRGEPTRALILTIAICQCGILLGKLLYNGRVS
jgi:hypothetical protein